MHYLKICHDEYTIATNNKRKQECSRFYPNKTLNQQKNINNNSIHCRTQIPLSATP